MSATARNNTLDLPMVSTDIVISGSTLNQSIDVPSAGTAPEEVSITGVATITSDITAIHDVSPPDSAVGLALPSPTLLGGPTSSSEMDIEAVAPVSSSILADSHVECVSAEPPRGTAWFIGTEYPYVPGPLSAISNAASQRWYAVTHGIRVGVFLDAASATDVTSGVKNASMVMRKFQHQALQVFNNALASGKVRILPGKAQLHAGPPFIIVTSDSEEDVE
ncbi:uncharacterized protein EV420DRAFT_1645664 [Desarmillaria tabescens]|uniref:Uncharacterized protein n=1 Tax=Armillaria tabescens TaxID=1929756 RepID=A0AA39K1E5_ARMTA|nr:uncharacterized protein EV420DRAFT_1645664 [Desarmillaria tabescens]KAK0452811.1 hypothetical protein EV420DRAFT_1645664 [Desarmillaria tabescens]